MAPDSLAVRDAAWSAYQAGLCVVPPREDRSKAPFGEWKEYQAARPAEGQLRQWYADGRHGVGIVTGAVSGNLELLEFDAGGEVYEPYIELARASGLGDVVQRIEAGYLERSPAGGIHWLYQCPGLEPLDGNTKLAQRLKMPEENKHLKNDTQVLIETRGEGGYVIVAPSFGPVHETGRPYELLRGSFATIANISPEERRNLFNLAKGFDQCPTGERLRAVQHGEDHSGRPGDEFNREANWRGFLEPHGWKWIYEHEGVTFWRRPGKDRGVSATTNYAASGLLYVFSTNTKFTSDRGYTPFSAYALLNHAGDFQAAARELARRGYEVSETSYRSSRCTRSGAECQ